MASTLLRNDGRPTRLVRVPGGQVGALLLSFYGCLLILTGFILVSDRFWHWFVIPVLLCGTIIGADAVNWLRGRLGLYDPVGLLGLLGLYFFFITPLLHVHWDLWTLFKVTPPPDWRTWLGAMAVLNCFGLVAFRLARWFILAANNERKMQTGWELSRFRFYLLVGSALLIAGLFQLYVIASFGGLQGYIAASEFPELWEGLGYTLAVAESFPILAFMAFTVFAVDRGKFKSWYTIGVALVVFIGVALLFRGLRGNRSDLIWPLFWMVGIVHLWVRPLPKRMIYLGLPVLVLFMYVYQFYDFYGVNGLTRVGDPAARRELAQRTGYSMQTILLGDLGRSDVQAFLLARLEHPDSDYRYAWGGTYISGLARLIPRSIFDRPDGKVKQGTEVQYGRGSYAPVVRQSAKVYGLAGEAMLNFGPLAVPFAFLFLGLLVGSVRHLVLVFGRGDSRRLLAPFLVNLCFVVLIADLDNVVWFLIKDGGLSILVVTLASTIVRTPGVAAGREEP